MLFWVEIREQNTTPNDYVRLNAILKTGHSTHEAENLTYAAGYRLVNGPGLVGKWSW